MLHLGHFLKQLFLALFFSTNSGNTPTKCFFFSSTLVQSLNNISMYDEYILFIFSHYKGHVLKLIAYKLAFNDQLKPFHQRENVHNLQLKW